MKGVILVIIVFLICAFVGYQVAMQFHELSGINPEATMTAPGAAGLPQKEYKIILIHVDRLDRPQPRMISVWFISFFFVEGNPPTLTFAQMYPNPANPENHQAFERGFSLTPKGDPAAGFWRVVKTWHIEANGYLLVDDFAVQKVMEWTNGAGDFPGLIGATQDHPDDSERVLMDTCRSVGGIANRTPAPFEFSDLFPGHFRSNLMMADAVMYWTSLTNTTLPIDCDVVLAP
jgi:hypothetical protein